MKYALELQDELYSLFIHDAEICKLVGIKDTTNIADCDKYIRRGIQPVAVVNEAPPLFFNYYVVPNTGINTKNYLVNEAVIEFDIYGKYKGLMTKLFKAINKVLKEHYEDMRLVAEGSCDSPVTGLYLYIFRVKPLVRT